MMIVIFIPVSEYIDYSLIPLPPGTIGGVQ